MQTKPKDPGVLRCAIYTRKSIEKGLDQAFNSLDAQFEVCMRCIHQHAADGWTLAGTYVDAAVSGTTVEREQLSKLRAEVRAHNIDCVVVYKLDRLSRDLGDFTNLMKEFSDNGVHFVSATQALENMTPEGKFTMNMMAAVADFEAAMIRTRLRDKFNEAKSKGYWVSGHAPFGYKKTKKSVLEVDKDEASTVRRIYNLFVSGCSYKEIREILVQEKRFYRVTRNNSKPTPWNSQILLRILTHVVYTGYIQTSSGLVKGLHKPIISQSLFEKAAQQVELLKNGPRKKVHNVEYPLKGILKCGFCGAPYVGSYTIKNGVIKRYYICKETRGTYAKGCADSPKFAADQLEGFLKKYLMNFRDSPQLLSALLEQLPQEDACRIADLLYSLDVALDSATPKEMGAIFRATFKQIVVNPNSSQLDVTLQDF